MLFYLQAPAPVESKDATFFEFNSPYYVATIIALVSMLSCAIVCGLIFEILRRKKAKKQQGKSYSNVTLVPFLTA